MNHKEPGGPIGVLPLNAYLEGAARAHTETSRRCFCRGAGSCRDRRRRPASPAGSGVSWSVLPPAAAVAKFHAGPRHSLWLGNPAAARSLVGILRGSAIDGFRDGPRLAAAAEAALARASTGDTAERAEAEQLLSAAWVMYVQALHWPSGGMTFADPSLAPKIPQAGSILDQAGGAPDLAAHLAAVSDVNPLYAQLRDAARAMGETVPPEMKASLDRARLLPANGRFVLVMLPASASG